MTRARILAAVEAARRLGIDDTSVAALGRALQPMTAAEHHEAATYRAAAEARTAREAARTAEWKSMTWADWSARRAAGTLPPTAK